MTHETTPAQALAYGLMGAPLAMLGLAFLGWGFCFFSFQSVEEILCLFVSQLSVPVLPVSRSCVLFNRRMPKVRSCRRWFPQTPTPRRS